GLVRRVRRAHGPRSAGRALVIERFCTFSPGVSGRHEEALGGEGMKRMGVLGGMSAQATMDFEARVHRVAQRLIPQNRSHGYPPMVVWYHRGGPLLMGADGRPLVPRAVDPGLIEAARWLGKSVDFIVMTCNAAHVGIDAIREAAACPVLSM